MEWRRKTRDLKRAFRWAWRSLGPRRHSIAAGAGGTALVLLLALGVWSCQSTPQRTVARPAGPGAMTPLAHEPEIRVRIRQGVESVKMEGPAQISVRPLQGGGEARRLPGPLTAAVFEEGMRITDGRGAHWRYPGNVEVSALSAEGMLKIETAVYAGRLRILVRAGEGGTPARLDVIEVVPIETYIAGVAVSEMLRNWSLPAFQVQSVAARSYAMHQRLRSQGMGRDFDLDSTVIDQAYNGWTDHAHARQGTAETRGMILMWQGRPLRAYYSSTCGGRTAGAAEIWPTGTGFEFNLDAPIQANDREHQCQISTSYTWEVSRTVAELSTRMREWGKVNGHTLRGIGQFRSVSIAESNSAGRPVHYTVVDDKGTRFRVGAEHLRNACNMRVASLPEITMAIRVRSGDLTMDTRGQQVTIRGRGFGHGVGMCQWCAEGMAKRGDGWREMLSRFYPGAGIERMY
jgi:stage II sporulation protein D